MKINNLIVALITTVSGASIDQPMPRVPAIATFNDMEYVILESVGELPSPTDFGVDYIPELTGLSEPITGYILDILIESQRMFLDELTVLSPSGEYPAINGVQADVRCWEANGMSGCNPGEYRSLKLGIEFDGRLRIARDFIENCSPRLPQEPQMFGDVKDLTFENGLLIKVVDRSEEASVIQQEFEGPDECGRILEATISPL